MKDTMKHDRTRSSIQRQLKALGCEQFDIGILNRQTGKMLRRFWKCNDIIKNLPWLKYQNQQGCDIYVRPVGKVNHGIILVDDIQRQQLQQLEEDELAPACIVETSPDNFQAWIRLSMSSLEPSLATRIARFIAKRYQADLNSADWRHYGRLVGFTNRKPKHVSSQGAYPYVLLHRYKGVLASRGAELIQLIKQNIQNIEHKQKNQQQKQWQRQIDCYAQDNQHNDPVTYFRQNLTQLEEKYGSAIDYSRVDWMIVKKMLLAGFKECQVKGALEQVGAKLAERKVGHINDYIERTISNAIKAINEQ